ncbi:DUF427 domain-containing protein [Paracraurococcus lichenis]|uniref:DUF427 domain-containing protein n=1 Tax=Paracraurococcus lichenis TaxID=3064888 RepID=A0ABT9E536_9PROT|nr:DUF427 domain-containing protein [Paracraurococcus sp. LOR1-02]MDO9711266.1 DUF427 domain-containing protein [Paracraurococcus sp. LOR1-02]
MTQRPLERVADYPRPPRLEPDDRLVRIILGGEEVARTREAWRVLETFHPPTWYLPPDAFRPGVLRPAPGGSLCEWKGRARYWTLAAGGRVAEAAGWSYPDPTPTFAAIAEHVAVYAGRMDACFLDDEQVTPQPGGFYGGWITRELVGPFKGGPGTQGW